MQAPNVIDWAYKGKMHASAILPVACSKCGAAALIKLPDEVRAEQPDDTTHVCHPMAGGCNHGFSDLPWDGDLSQGSPGGA